ncbi:hypothetical protein HC928_05605 [bacterium]|nr:hypothetical protein [bacterium]
MYCVELTIQPTAALTFRILPGSILNIATYPFVPPTSLSGYLRRLSIMSAGREIPGTEVKNPATYLLPPRYITLGAYSTHSRWSGVHRTYRKGMDKFTHDAFSSIYREKNDKENIQLHTWEYLITEELVGYVVSDSAEQLAQLQDLQAYGCYIGKEGYAILKDVSEVIDLERETLAAYPSTVTPVEELIQNNQFLGGYDIYNLYRYNWLPEAQDQSDQDGFWGTEPTSVDGFIPFVGAYFASPTDTPPTLDYYTDRDEIFIPASLVDLLRGENYAQSV